MSWLDGTESLRHKYDPLPEDAPRHRKKARKRRVRSDHKHEYEFVRNIYGDEIQVAGYRRSWWRCKKCGKWRLDPNLYLELERKEADE